MEMTQTGQIDRAECGTPNTLPGREDERMWPRKRTNTGLRARAEAMPTRYNLVFVGVPRTLEAGLCRWARVMAVLCS